MFPRNPAPSVTAHQEAAKTLLGIYVHDSQIYSMSQDWKETP